MREDDEFVHYVPILRRIIILVAVITAVPVVLWTITAFVRAYVAPAKIPTFHQLASTASFNTPTNSISAKAAGDRPAPAAEQSKLPDPHPATIEARTTVADASDSSTAPKGPLLGDHAPRAAANTTAPDAVKIANAPAAMPAESSAPSVTGSLAAQQPPDASAESAADDLPAAAPLTGPIPLPRQRPRDATIRIADMAPSSVPIPRPRPDAAGPGAPTEKSHSPIGFIQNLFH